MKLPPFPYTPAESGFDYALSSARAEYRSRCRIVRYLMAAPDAAIDLEMVFWSSGQMQALKIQIDALVAAKKGGQL
jgi:hypothetical protein